jgi:hypothetical protein
MRRSLFVPLFCVQLIQIALVPPANLPCNDDWLYASISSKIISEGRYEHHPFLEPIALLHVYTGAIIERLFGESFVVLRVSTLVLALVGAWAAAKCATVCGIPRRYALLCGTTVLINPLYLNLSNTFMSDVPFLAYMTISSYFYLKALRSGNLKDVLMGGFFGVISFFVRQIGEITVAAYVAAMAVSCLRSRSIPPLRHWAAVIPPWVIAVWGFNVWKNSLELRQERHFTIPTEHLAEKAQGSLAYAVCILVAMGFYVLPFTVMAASKWLWGAERWSRSRFAAFVVCALFFASIFAIQMGAPMPSPGNVIHTFGIGPHTIAGIPEFGQVGTSLITPIWITITILGILSASLAIARSAVKVRGNTASSFSLPHTVYLMTWATLVFASSYTTYLPVVFDRYTLQMISPLSILAAASMTPGASPRVFCAGILAAVGLYVISIAALQDYTKWNAARKDAFEYLVREMKVPQEQIDAGYEYTGPAMRDAIREKQGRLSSAEFKEKWSRYGAYEIAFEPLPGYRIEKSFPYYSWLGFSTRHVYALKRDRKRPGFSE